jgi:hypothetical protein
MLSRRGVGYSRCAPPAVHAARRGIIVNQRRRGGVEVAVIEPGASRRSPGMCLMPVFVHVTAAEIVATTVYA